jgi:RimJ/RimL family protein N-acetyltransferase
MVQFANNPRIAENLRDGFPHPYTREDGLQFINRFMNDDPVRIFAIEYDHQPCGSIGILPQEDIHRRSAEVGYWLAEPFWGRGIATEAVRQIIEYGFRTWDINRIFACPYSTNSASQRVLEKAGMKYEARLIKAIWKNGKFLDELIYSILRPEP